MKYERKESDRYYYNFLGQEGPTVIIAGENGITQAHIDVLLDFEYEEKKKTDARERKEITYDDAIESEMICEENATSKEEELVREIIETLSEAQQDLYYKHFGRCMYLEDIAKERGVTRQAIYSQLQTIKRKVIKEYERRGLL